MRLLCHGSLCLCGVFIIVLGAVLIPLMFDVILTFVVKQIMVICPCSQLFPTWREPSAFVALYQTFYFFEIQNPEDTLNGAKPVVKEIGPYSYKVHMERTEAEWNKNFTVTYIQPLTYYFAPERSVGPDTDVFTTINFPLVAALSAVKYMPGLFQDVVQVIIKETNSSLFRQLTVDELLWGYYDPLLDKLQALAGKKLIPDTSFGFLMGRNGTSNGLYTTFTGANDSSLFAKIDVWNGTKSLDWWYTKEANMINGTDGTMFHPFIDKSETLYLFNPDACRSFPYEYVEDASYEGIPLLKYYVPPSAYGNPKEYPSNTGFCESDCPLSGVLNISTCARGAPMGLSNPHFLYGSPKLIDSVGGIHPNKSIHENYMKIEPIMGLPYIFAERLQINLFVEKLKRIPETGNVRSFYYPFLWFEETVVVRQEDADKYKDNILVMKRISRIIQIVLPVLGGLLVLSTVFLIVRSCSVGGEKDKKNAKMSSRTRNGAVSNDPCQHADTPTERSPLLQSSPQDSSIKLLT